MNYGIKLIFLYKQCLEIFNNLKPIKEVELKKIVDKKLSMEINRTKRINQNRSQNQRKEKEREARVETLENKIKLSNL